jgi:Lamin Tail Domain
MPTESPTKSPTKTPTLAPTNSPTKSPTKIPTESPTKTPTKVPTKAPTTVPTKAPVHPNSLIVINEIMYDPDIANDTPGEWFELYNRGTTDTVNLKNWSFKDQGTQITSIWTDLFIGPGQYLVIGQVGTTSQTGGLTADFFYPICCTASVFFLTNSADAIIMTDSSGVERGRVVYGAANGFVDPSGASISLKSPELDTNVGANWCVSGTVWSGSTVSDFGTPGAANVCVP